MIINKKRYIQFNTRHSIIFAIGKKQGLINKIMDLNKTTHTQLCYRVRRERESI